jgi:hypothetical protein
MTDSYIWRVGEALDRFLNVLLFRGDVEESISYHASTKVIPPRRKLWACVMCKWLDLTVEKNHCLKALYGVNISKRGGMKAGIQLLVLFLALTGLFWFSVFHH